MQHPYTYGRPSQQYGLDKEYLDSLTGEEREAYLAHLAMSNNDQIRVKQITNGDLTQPNGGAVEIVLKDEKGNKKEEYVIEAADPRHEAMRRRRIYDEQLKKDIIITGKGNSMNATFDPVVYHHYNYRNHGY